MRRARDAVVVYGDYLAQNGDPRAELIAAHEANVPEAAKLQARFAAEILGGLDRAQGFAEVLWRRGFIEHVTLAPDLEGELEYDEYYGERRRYPPNDLGAALLRVGSEPSAELLRSLTIRHHQTPSEEMLALLVALLPQALRDLTFDGGECDIAEVLDTLPRLRRVIVNAYRVTLSEPIQAPRLGTLDLHGIVEPNSVRALIESDLPSLRRIWVTRTGEADRALLAQKFGERLSPFNDTDAPTD